MVIKKSLLANKKVFKLTKILTKFKFLKKYLTLSFKFDKNLFITKSQNCFFFYKIKKNNLITKENKQKTSRANKKTNFIN